MRKTLQDEVSMIQKIETICYNMTFCPRTLETLYDNIALNATFKTVGNRRHLFIDIQGRFVNSCFPYQL